MTVYIRLVLAGRVTMSYVAGVLGTAFGIGVFVGLFRGASVLDAFGPLVMFVVIALIVSTPFYLVAVIVAFVFGRSVAAQPAIWSAAAVLIVIGLNYLVPPFDVRLTHMYVIPTALIAGACFWVWNVWKPVTQNSS